MAALNSPGQPDEYMDSGRWKVWTGQLDMPSQGWKFHIAVASAQDAQRVLDAVATNVLKPMGAAHKHWPTTDPIGALGDNGGKWFAVYPASVLNAFVLAAEIERQIGTLNVPVPGNNAVPNEIMVDRGWVYARYGSFNYAGVRAPDGTFEADLRTRTHPAWAENPWGQYSRFVAQGGAPSQALTARFPEYGVRDVPKQFRSRR